jgi:tellurite resistance protein TehA-like permease
VAASGTRGFLDSKRDTIIALTPFAALALFFLTGSWLWFLMIPVMGIRLYGPDGRKKPPHRGR